MSRTREHYGHNKSARKIRDKETGELVDAKNTILYHQVLAFLPDECDVNGGRLKPEDCMRFAKEYASRYYPNQQIVFALHKEHCKEDHTYVGWDTVDGINAELQDQYEHWGVTEDGRHCCTDCLTVTGDDRYVTPDGTAATLLNGIHITERT